MYSRFLKKKKKSKYCNNRYLSSAEMLRKIYNLRLIKANNSKYNLRRLRKKIKQSYEMWIIYLKGSFRRLFWEEQFKVARLTNSRQIRTSGMVKLLSERTLCDYTHYYQECTRFSEEVDQMLANLSDWKRGKHRVQ